MKIIIIEATQVNLGGDTGAQHCDVGSVVDVDKEQARNMAEWGRALYCDKANDHFKDGRFTASAAMLKAAEDMAKAAKAAAKAAE